MTDRHNELSAQIQYRLVERLAALVNTLRDIVLQTDDEGCITFVNPAWSSILGHPRASVVGHPLDEFVVDEDRTVLGELFVAPEHEVGRDVRFTTTRGERLVFEATFQRGLSGGYFISLRDVTERKRREDRRVEAIVYRLGTKFASELDRTKLMQLIVDEVTSLVGASFGALVFYDDGDRGGGLPSSREEHPTLHARTAGATAPPSRHYKAPVSQEHRTPGPHGPGEAASLECVHSSRDAALTDRLRAGSFLPLFEATQREHASVRLADLRDDARFAGSALEALAVPLVSYLAVPVREASGELFGLLMLGHGQADRFTEEHERIGDLIAKQASLAVTNAQLFERLRKSEARARDADARKDEFLALLGHELRNPLSPLAVALELMDMQASPSFERERAIMKRQVHKLQRLVDDLLDLSRITRGKIVLAIEPHDLATIVAGAVETASPMFEAREQRVTLALPPDVIVHADPGRLAQVFANLLVNAAKYSRNGTETRVEAEAIGEEVVIRVRDEGEGIPPELMPRLFDAFAQGERTIDRAAGGLGVGLAIVKSLVDLHRGSITAKSDGRDRGSTFEVRLPREASASVAPASSRRIALAPSGPVASVLVVDDNHDAADMLCEWLRGVGYRVAVAYDGVSGLEQCNVGLPDAVLLDIGLPVMDGYEVARRLRAKSHADKLVLIALTGYGQESDRRATLAAGFDAHLVKPVELSHLSKTLAGMLETRLPA